MVQVTWTLQALDDLQAVHEYVAHDSQRYADLFIDRLVEASARLADLPNPGRMVPEYQDPNIRELLISNYRLIYRVKPHAVQVLAVHHGARLLPLSIDEQP